MSERRAVEWRTTYQTPDFPLVADALLTVVEAEALGAEWKRRIETGNPPGVNEHVWATVNGRLVGARVQKP